MEGADADAIVRAQGGDLEAFRQLFERHGRRVYRLSYRMTGSHEDAEDVVQETFLKAHRHLSDFDFRAGFATWIFRIAANASLDLLRSRKRRAETGLPEEMSLAASGPGVERLARSAEVRRVLADSLEQLTPQERAAFILRHVEGVALEEIGAALGLSINGTKQSVFRAVQKVRRALAPHVPASSGSPS